VTDEFRSFALPAADPGFDALLASVRWDDVARGRRGAVLVQPDADGAVPIVRTTTAYRAPAQPFRPVHAHLAHAVRRVAALSADFNHALIEHYTPAYATMKHHSDQALDLAEDSSIAVLSCYRDPARPSRRLLVRPKQPGGSPFELVLAHASVVTFSLATNRRFTHAIVPCAGAPANDWLGVTFRVATTRVRFVDGHARLADGTPLTLADDDQRRAFLALRRRENAELDFTYPPLSYTISESDLWPPAP
jgi:hypothetical protein